MTVNVVETEDIKTEVVDISKDRTKAKIMAGPYIKTFRRRADGKIEEVGLPFFLSTRTHIDWPIPREYSKAARRRAYAVLFDSDGHRRHPKKVKRERKEPPQLNLPFKT